MTDADRAVVQGILAVTLALALAVVLQGRIFEAKDDFALPPVVRRWGPVVDALATITIALFTAGGIAVALTVLSNDDALTSEDRSYLALFPTVLALWAFAVALIRRVLPVLWIPPARPWLPVRLDESVAIATAAGIVLAFALGVTLSVEASDISFITTWIPVALLSIVAFVAVVIGAATGNAWVEGRRLDAALELLDLHVDAARLAGGFAPEPPSVPVLRRTGDHGSVWLTAAQAEELALAWRWANSQAGRAPRESRERAFKFRAGGANKPFTLRERGGKSRVHRAERVTPRVWLLRLDAADAGLDSPEASTRDDAPVATRQSARTLRVTLQTMAVFFAAGSAWRRRRSEN